MSISIFLVSFFNRFGGGNMRKKSEYELVLGKLDKVDVNTRSSWRCVAPPHTTEFQTLKFHRCLHLLACFHYCPLSLTEAVSIYRHSIQWREPVNHPNSSPTILLYIYSLREPLFFIHHIELVLQVPKLRKHLRDLFQCHLRYTQILKGCFCWGFGLWVSLNSATMDGSLRILLVSCALVSMLVSSSAQTCGSYTFSNNNLYTSCTDLSELGSYIHWTRHTNGTLEIAYRQPDFSSTNWIAWAINLNSTGMVGAQSLVAYVNSSAPYAYTSPVSSYSTTLAPGSLSFSVPKIEAENSNGEMIIYATLELSSSLTTVNQVWQEGPLSGGTPGTHSTTGEHVQSMGTLDLLSGQTSTGGSATSSRVRRRNVSDSIFFLS